MTLTSLRPWSSPMRPVPMIPTRMVMSFEPFLFVSGWDAG
jgi:hypothetical protein